MQELIIFDRYYSPVHPLTMLGLALLYFLAKPFYKLAEQYGRNQIGYSLLAIIVYYAGVLGFGLMLGIVLELTSPGSVEGMNDFFLGLICIPAGLFTAWILYNYLEKRFKGHLSVDRQYDANIIDAELIRKDD